ncbi:MAG: glycoside hydrolase family 5 [Sphingomonas bacterium]|uniref:glycoside hydrolase family 5 protein n=1 Tax=Sphingomonas bacterium TaxID=1895847 RepID=UPI00262AF84E|nr:glycoside hydrolase family 5 protein [Sphingomonas bacterium]MDB5706861.1 glycoside hydrolase family 5 [Sphingomonas bacterium]
MKQPLALISMLALCVAGCSGGATASPSTPAPAPAPSPAPGPTPTPAPTSTAALYTPVAAAHPTAGIALPLGKCVNMGNHLEAPNEGDWGRAIAEDDFTIIKAAGFTSVRLPVRFSGHASTAAPFTIDAAFMTRVRHVVDLATAAGLNVIIDLHNYDELMADPDGNAVRFAGLWKQIATTFASAPSTVWFELINEPHDALTNARLPSVITPALAEIRKTNPTRPVIVGGEGYSGIGSLATLPMPADPYVVPTFHYYDPFQFTHQGATWVTPTPPLGRVFGGTADIAEIDRNLQTVRDYISRTGRVPFVGEYGANDVAGVPVSERINYYGTITAAYASVGVQSCAWAYTNTFRLRDGDHWIPGMVEAIRTTTTLQ